MLILQRYFQKNNILVRVKTSIILTLISLSICYLLVINTEISKSYDFDTNEIYIKVIDPLYVFLQNMRLLVINFILGSMTFGTYVITTLFQNLQTIIVISNALYINDKSLYIFRLIPHGIIEITLLYFILISSFEMSLKFLRLIKKVMQKKSVLNREIKIILKEIRDVLFSTVFITFLASIIEYLVSVYIGG